MVYSLEKARQYRKKISTAATDVLQPLLDNISAENILVIGAGTFPSYENLLSILGPSPSRKFTLIEPDQKALNIFLNHFAKNTIDVITDDLKWFLQTTDKKFDLIYFEHPETMTVPLVLAVLGVKSLKRVMHLREALPFLGRVVSPVHACIATCMSKHELTQLKTLLKFSVPIEAWYEVMQQKFLTLFYSGPYTHGLRCQIAQNRHPEQTARAIRRSHYYLVLALALSISIYLVFCSQFSAPIYIFERLLAIVLIGAQLFLHRPGKLGWLIKNLLILLLMLVTLEPFFSMT